MHATCIDCGEEVVSKCGTLVSHHFAHKANSNCGTQFHDHKSEWHQQWQHTIIPAVPGKNVEVTIKNDATIKRADMISHANCVIEFQHSHLSLPERLEREGHYKNIIWVVHSDKIKSRTWKHKTPCRVFFNGDDNRIWWRTNTHYTTAWGERPLMNCHMEKSEFISRVINNKHYNNEVFYKIEERNLKRRNAESEYWNQREDELSCTFLYGYREHDAHRFIPIPTFPYHTPIFQIKSKFYVAAIYIISEMIKIDDYHKKIETEKAEAKKRIDATAELKLKEQRAIKDPSFLQSLLKAEAELEYAEFVIEKTNWVKRAAQIWSEQNKARIEKQTYEKEERDRIQSKQLNVEITNSINRRLDRETQDRVRIDLIRAQGGNTYAAESARKRLAIIGIHQ
jgi:competence CoiA-like predicted nuclease